jgi:hypothetical protein
LGDSTRLQQDAATALRVIGEMVRQAGARRLMDTPGGTVSFNPGYTGIEVNPNTWQPAAAKGADGASEGPDTLQLDRDHTLTTEVDVKSPLNTDNTDCLGQPTVPGNNVTSTFSVDAGELKCKGSGSTDGAYALIAGVEDFQVWYGLRQGAGLRYTTATALNPARLPAPGRFGHERFRRHHTRLPGRNRPQRRPASPRVLPGFQVAQRGTMTTRAPVQARHLHQQGIALIVVMVIIRDAARVYTRLPMDAITTMRPITSPIMSSIRLTPD